MKFYTHDGHFHADEVAAYAILHKLHPHTPLIRTRDEEILKSASQNDYLFDVGGVYDPKNNRFDHHQEGCYEVFTQRSKIPLSSVGMVYKEHGKAFIRTIINHEKLEDNIDNLYELFYFRVIMEIDALDNGEKMFDTTHKAKYYITTNITGTINKLNGIDKHDDKKQIDKFKEGAKLILSIFKIHLEGLFEKMIAFDQDYPAICQAMKQRYEIHETGEIIIMEVDCPNWQNCISEYEKSNHYDEGELLVKFIMYKNNDEWRVRAIKNKGADFTCRHYLKPLKDIGLAEDEIKDVKFIHNNLFIAAFRSKEVALHYAINSLS